MNAPLYRLVYSSRDRMPGAGAAREASLRGIVQACRRNNRAASLTGAIMLSAGSFAQAIEGPRTALEATFERIQRDERHGEVSLLAYWPVPLRAFPRWSMALVDPASRDLDPALLSGDALLDILLTHADLSATEDRLPDRAADWHPGRRGHREGALMSGV